jgi:hypothetical protein
MAKKQTSTPSRRNVAKASTSNARRRPERSVDMLTGSRDPAIIVNTLRDNWNGSLQHQRPLSMSRAYAELVKLLEGPRPDPAPYWGKLKFYADLLRTHFALPRVLKFFPRNSVPTGPQYKGYNEDPYQRTFSSPHAGESTAPGASGYGLSASATCARQGDSSPWKSVSIPRAAMRPASPGDRHLARPADTVCAPELTPDA